LIVFFPGVAFYLDSKTGQGLSKVKELSRWEGLFSLSLVAK